jgi:hypothetical protein
MDLTSRTDWQACQVFVGSGLLGGAWKSLAEFVSVGEHLLNARQEKKQKQKEKRLGK